MEYNFNCFTNYSVFERSCSFYDPEILRTVSIFSIKLIIKFHAQPSQQRSKEKNAIGVKLWDKRLDLRLCL